jgi:hypothetical protein
VRICFVADARNIHTIKWARYFLERGKEILVLSHYEAFIPDEPFIPGAKVLPWPKVTSKNRLIRKFEMLRNAWAFRSMVRAFEPDIVHIHYISNNVKNLLWYWGMKNLFVSPWGSDIIKDYSAEIEGFFSTAVFCSDRPGLSLPPATSWPTLRGTTLISRLTLFLSGLIARCFARPSE